MDENKRGSFGSTIGFLLSAIGSAVGLGNIWGFPYKMGRCGGFTFLIVYLALAAFVGFAIMLSELAIGRSTGFGPVNAYKKISKKFKWIGWLAIIAPFLIMTFYSVLGGYCIYYMVINVVGMFSGMPDSSSFAALLTNPWASIGCMVLFMLICYLINRGGVGGGIEKFNTIGMPALFVMLVIVIIRAWTLPNADVGLKYMFVPGYALKAGFFDKAPGFMEVLATAGGQMFFSLSLAMGAMITYGSYLGKNENLPKNSVIIVISDTLVAIMAGLAVIPAAVANGIAKGMAVSDIKLGGPNLLFATLQDVFHDMGTIGGIFGLIFYALVLIAAISSAISLIEAVSVTFIDHASAKGHERAVGARGGAAAGPAGAGDEPRDRAAAKAAEQRAHETQARDARDEPLLLRRAHGLGLSRVVLVLGLLGPGVVVRCVVARRGIARVVAGVEVRVLVAALGLGADDVIRHVLAVVDLCAAACAEARARLERRAALWAHAARCGVGLVCRCLRLRGARCRMFGFRLFVFGEIGSVVHVICLPADWFFEVSIS